MGPKRAPASKGAAVLYFVRGIARALRRPGPGQRRCFWSLALDPAGRWLLSDELVRGGDRWHKPFGRTSFGSRVVLRRPDSLVVIRELRSVARVLAVSPDGEHLLGLDRLGWVALWETHRWSMLMRFAPGSLDESSGAFSRSGREMGMVDQRARVSLWDTVTGRRIRVIPQARELFGFVKNGTACLVSSGRGSGTTVFVADAGSGATIRNLGHELGQAWQLTLSPLGSLAATRERDDEVLIWSTNAWTQSRRFELPSDRRQGLAWSADGTVLVGEGRAGTVWHIDVSTGRVTKIYTRSHDRGQLAATRKAELVAVSDGDRIIMLKRRQ